MNVDTVKIELIDWITRLKDPLLISKLLELKKTGTERKAESKVYGSGKHLIEFIAEDFNEPLDDFKPYQQQ
jgi:hypothetical protein